MDTPKKAYKGAALRLEAGACERLIGGAHSCGIAT